MKILIASKDRRIQLAFPTGMLFSSSLLRFCLKAARWQTGVHVDVKLPDIPPEKLEILCAEIMRVKRKYKRYELIDVVSSDGDHVNITL